VPLAFQGHPPVDVAGWFGCWCPPAVGEPRSIEGCEDAVGGAVLFGHAAGSDRVGRTGPDETNPDGFQCVLDCGVAGRPVGAVIRGDVHGVRSRGACNVGNEIDRVTVHDEQLTLDGGAEMVQGVDEVFLANRPGGFPQVRIDNEKRDDPTIAISSGGLDRRQQCGVIE